MSAATSAERFVGPGAAAGRLKPLSRFAGAPLALVRDPLRIVLFILTILTISRAHEHYGILAKFRPALLLVVASVGYAFLNPRFLTSTNVLRLWPTRLTAALGVAVCCSAAFGISLGGSATFILDSYVKTLAYAFLIAVSVRHVRDLYTFVWAYVASCGVLAFFSIFVFGITRANGVARLNNLYTYDSNDLGVVMMVGFPLTLLLLTVDRGKKRWLLLFILIGISATMARSGSRGGFLGFVAVGATALILANGVSAARRFAVAVAAFIALAIGAPPGYWEQMSTILSPKEDYNFTEIDGRKAVMERGIGYMVEHPVFGLGIANFSKAECTISTKLEFRRIYGPLRCTPPHNSFIEAAAETGVIGFLIWGSLVIGGIFAPLRLRRRLPASWRRGTHSERFIYGAASFFPIAMVGFAVPGFFVTFAWVDPLYFLTALLTGLYVAAKVQFEQGDGSAAGRPAQSQPAVAGWRVRQSSGWRSSIGSEARRAAQ